MKKIIFFFILALVLIYFFPKNYISSPGHVTQEMNQQFEMTKKNCAGWSKLTNAEAMAADAPGESLCFGWLY